MSRGGIAYRSAPVKFDLKDYSSNLENPNQVLPGAAHGATWHLHLRAPPCCRRSFAASAISLSSASCPAAALVTGALPSGAASTGMTGVSRASSSGVMPVEGEED